MSSSRLVYGRVGSATPFWVWLLQRASAILLGPIVFVHVGIRGASQNRWVDGSLLLVVLAHGYIGLWRLIAGRSASLASSPFQVAMTLVVLCMAVLGVFVLWGMR